ncbi:hypothetical protein NP493_73g05046 [Ridgeia piscesae]|uniref:Uncharacterized protein n=1 Tax=Ridgeia piscesae TaxID=27915 RepID=A0AAD9UIM0_RIDPI|nr:hypothetical protein NP493_73g05046 [Ridgeia piscesae]
MAVETGIETRYSSSQSTVLGWVQVVTGSVVIIAGIVALSTYKGDIIVADLFTGLLMIGTGACGVVAGKHRKASYISAFMVLSMITSIAAIAAFFVWIVEADEVEQKYRRSGQVGVATFTSYVFIFAYLTEGVASIWSAVIAGDVTCCKQRHPGVRPVNQLPSVQQGCAQQWQPYGEQGCGQQWSPYGQPGYRHQWPPYGHHGCGPLYHSNVPQEPPPAYTPRFGGQQPQGPFGKRRPRHHGQIGRCMCDKAEYLKMCTTTNDSYDNRKILTTSVA